MVPHAMKAFLAHCLAWTPAGVLLALVVGSCALPGAWAGLRASIAKGSCHSGALPFVPAGPTDDIPRCPLCAKGRQTPPLAPPAPPPGGGGEDWGHAAAHTPVTAGDSAFLVPPNDPAWPNWCGPDIYHPPR
jgi:hypothetical protein